jgi:hypothetical protein
VNIARPGACPADTAIACSQQIACPGDARCNLDQGRQAQCATVPALDTGVCWVLPRTCPEVAPKVRPCAGGACAFLCSAINAQQPFFPQPNCP